MNPKRRWSVVVITVSLMLGGILLPVTEPGYAEQAKLQKAANHAVTLQYNGVTLSQRGILIEGKTWLPISLLRDAVKLPLNYDTNTKTYTIGQGNRQLNLSIYEGGITSYMNGIFIGEGEAKNINGRIYIPFQWVKDYLGYEGKWDQASKRLNLVKMKENKLTITTKNIDQDIKQASIHLKYPQLSGSGNQEVEKIINATLSKDNKAFQDSIDKHVEEIANEAIRDPYQFTSTYLITYNQNGVLSLLTEHYEYTGGAHGMAARRGYTFSLIDGKQLTLDDLFGENKDYSKQLNAKLKAKLNASPGYFGGFEGLGDQPDFYLKPEALTVFFQIYEVMPYPAGFPEYSFPFHELLSKGSSPFDNL